jgi:signal peptidase I
MSETWIKDPEFGKLVKQVLASGNDLRFQAWGASMEPFIHNGDTLIIRPLVANEIKVGDAVLYENDSGRILVHRLIKANAKGTRRTFLVKGDALPHPDGSISPEEVLGVVVAIDRTARRVSTNNPIYRIVVWIWLLSYSRLVYRKLLAAKFRLGIALDRLRTWHEK